MPELSLHNVKPVDISVRDLTVSTCVNKTKIPRLFKKKKNNSVPSSIEKEGDEDIENQFSPDRNKILNDISLDARSGQLLAIIGGSGSGKTSLLNVMAARMGSLDINGTITYNGNSNIHKIRHAYVIQQDILIPNLTCRETLKYSSELRLGCQVSKEYQEVLVEEIILELGLKECADTLVGDESHRGLSGGEKRRLSIGIQLLSNPSVLFLDEPTTGLDAFSALQLVETMQHLARKGRTVIMSIHQPRSDIFFLLDNLILLSRGSCVYFGNVLNIVPYFANIGFPTPDLVNPADYIIDISSVDTRSPQAEKSSYAQLKILLGYWNGHKHFEPPPLSPPDDDDDGMTVKQGRLPLYREAWVLTRRTFKENYRDYPSIISLNGEAIIMGIICGWVFYKLKPNITGIRSMLGALYTANGLQGYLLLLYETYRLCYLDIKIFDRERNEGVVTVGGFLISRRLSKLLFEDIPVPFIFSLIMYFMVGFEKDGKKFFTFYSIILLQHFSSLGFGVISVGLSRNLAISNVISNLCFTLQSMACGYFVNAKYMPVYVRWTKWIAHVFYGFSAAAANQFTNYFGNCPYPDIYSTECDQYRGSYQLQQLGVPENWITIPIIVTMCFAIGYYIIGGLLLQFIRVDITLSKEHKMVASSDKEEEEESIILQDALNETKQEPMGVKVRNLNLYVKKRTLSRKQHDGKHILKWVNADFNPGTLNAIMGPSGCGKSSLLNVIAGRTRSSLMVKFKMDGEIKIDGMGLVSYVCQDDDGLLPSLTVRETLYYAAELRLSNKLTNKEKKIKAEKILIKMGLKECANTIIGSEFVKGISGGEKRRVSIGVQLLSDPEIILLDEPTSGLDSFTASSIMQVLKELTNEGKTVICSIHQPRSDLFRGFGNILLLGKGGSVAYNGIQEGGILNYFKQEFGYICPKLTNPGDFLLDLVSIDLQSIESEEESRKRVEYILQAWEKHIGGGGGDDKKIDRENHDEIMVIKKGIKKKSLKRIGSSYGILIRRGGKNFWRQVPMIIARLTQAAGLGIILALFFSPLSKDYIGNINRLGLIQEITALYFIGMLNNVTVYPMERDVFYREYQDGAYGVIAFFLSYSSLELPFEIITSLIFAIFVSIIPNLSRTSNGFFSLFYCSLLIINCGESVGIIFNTIINHSGFAINAISIILSIGTFMAGIMSLNMPPVLRAFNWLSPLKYGVIVIINYTFIDINGGVEFIKAIGLYNSNPGYFIIYLTICTIVYRLISFIILYISRMRW